jgi:phenylacetyl-CoA:acceptor oxidoreductase subunit 2
VWLEIGRKLRAIHVFFNPRTSWMTREAFVALFVFAFALTALLMNSPGWARAGAFAALVFVWCQGRILHASKGIPAWRLPEVVPLIVTTGLAEGTGLYLIAQPGPLGATLLGLAVIARALAWSRYRGALQAGKVRAALEAPGRLLMQLGTVVPLVLALASYFTPYAAMLAGLAAIAAGWIFKLALVTRASYNQGFALPRLPVRGVR